MRRIMAIAALAPLLLVAQARPPASQPSARAEIGRAVAKINAALGRCPLCEFLFGRWCRSFGYSHLGGKTPEEVLRMKLHMDLGAMPTLTVRSAGEILQPNPAVDEVLRAAGA